jgi:hypothetical protein
MKWNVMECCGAAEPGTERNVMECCVAAEPGTERNVMECNGMKWNAAEPGTE